MAGHVDVEGNELADFEAKRGSIELFDEVVESVEEVIVAGRGGRKKKKTVVVEKGQEVRDGRNLANSFSAILALYNEQLLENWGKRWKEEVRGKGLRKIDKAPPGRHVLRIHEDRNRRHNSILTQLCTDRSHLNACLFKMGVHPTPYCDCGPIKETREHFFLSCPLYYHQRRALRQELGSTTGCDISSLLTDPLAIPATLRFINDSNRFSAYYSYLLPLDQKRKEWNKGKKGKKGKKK